MRRWASWAALGLWVPALAEGAPLRAVVHVATHDGAPAADAAWLEAQWQRVRELLGPSGVEVEAETRVEGFAAHLTTRADRSALARHVTPGAIDVFVVESLVDVDEPARMRRGVHWRAGGAHYVIVASYAVAGGAPCPPEYTCNLHDPLLAHELGHYFGLGHDARTDNLMSYSRAGGPIWLDEPQRAQLGRGLLRARRAR